jgi:hypothetical protein
MHDSKKTVSNIVDKMSTMLERHLFSAHKRRSVDAVQAAGTTGLTVAGAAGREASECANRDSDSGPLRSALK